MVSRFIVRRRACAVGMMFSTLCVGHAQAQEPEQSVEGSQVEEGLVTGSRIAREGLDTSTPVSIIAETP